MQLLQVSPGTRADGFQRLACPAHVFPQECAGQDNLEALVQFSSGFVLIGEIPILGGNQPAY